MIRTEKFLISTRLYAVDLSSLEVEPGNMNPMFPSWYATASAMWFRRKHGVTAACLGLLWDIQDEPPFDAPEFLAANEDGRYGGDCQGRWDGTRYWGAQEPHVAAAHLSLLQPMLAAYPEIPEGYDGWWKF